MPISSRSILPTGMPVQPEITSPTIDASTHDAHQRRLALQRLELASVRELRAQRVGVAAPSAAVRAVRASARRRGAAFELLPRLLANLRSTRPALLLPARASSVGELALGLPRAAAAIVGEPLARGRRRRADSRSSTRVCTARSSSGACASSIAGGVALWPSARRAHAVSSTLTALSGSWRSGR